MTESNKATDITIDAKSTAGVVDQIQDIVGGTIKERWGEHILVVDNDLAKGTIRFITFDWGVNLLEFDITFTNDIKLEIDSSKFNPIQFIYCLAGHIGHRFGTEVEMRNIEQFQSVIISGKDGEYNLEYFPKEKKLEVNIIQIFRKKFLKKRLNNVSSLHQKLYEVFLDSDHENAFAYFGTFNLKMADAIVALRKNKDQGMIRILQIEGLVFQILSLHIAQHDKAVSNKPLVTSLRKKELRAVRKLGNHICDNPSFDYSLEYLSKESGLAQAKLQEGFKLLFAHTVTEYIRHVRLEEARDLINTTDLNISEIVYTIGFSSRSYFSKIFKEKYSISPRAFKKRKEGNFNTEDALS